VKIDEGQQKIKIVRTRVPANQFSPSASTLSLTTATQEKGCHSQAVFLRPVKK